MHTLLLLENQLIKWCFSLLFILVFQTYSFSSDCDKLNSGTSTIKEFTYTIKVDPSSLDKENYEVLTSGLSVYNRYFLSDAFQFKSSLLYSKDIFETRFAQINVSILSFSVSEAKANNYEVEKVGGVDCEAAQLLCSNGAVPGNSGGFGVQELGATNRGCLAGNEHQSSWYYLNVQTGGTLSMMIDPAVNSDDYDFAIWGPFTAATAGLNCPPITLPIRCSFSSISDRTGLQSMNLGTSSGCGFLGLFACSPFAVTDLTENSGGDSFVMPLNVLANEIYILVVDNFSTSSNPYDMTFGGSAVLGCTPIVLPVEFSAFNGKEIGTVNRLYWTTESELNNSYFDVEWTATPENDDWKSIGLVPSYGNSSSTQEYQLTHSSPVRGKVNYYRVSQIDKNGVKRTYPELVYVDNEGMNRTLLKTVNSMGKEVPSDSKGLVIYWFDDGTTLKVMN